MRILSIDVGIKNLAYCLLECKEEDFLISDINIIKWDSIDLMNSYSVGEKEIPICTFIDSSIKSKKGKSECKTQKCFNISKYKKGELFVCKKHVKKVCFLVPTKELQESNLKKQTLSELIKISDKYGISYEKPTKKQDLFNKIVEYNKKSSNGK
jgi:hypothetical protein